MKDTVTLTAVIKTPEVPDFLEIMNIRHAHLDDAIADKGKALVVDVAALDDTAIERIGRQWTTALQKKAASRRDKLQQGVENVS